MDGLQPPPVLVSPQAALFGQLGVDVFTVFAGGNRRLYERAVLAVYEQLYRSDLMFPTQAEVVAVIYECLTREPELWSEDEAPVDLDRLVTRSGRRVRRRRVEGADTGATGVVITRSRHIYNRLLQTGWLDEATYGLKVTVEMPSGPMRLAEFLCTMRDGTAEQLGGLVVEVRNAIRAVREKPGENALGLNKAARDASAFGRYLRSVLSALREVDRQVLASDTLADRLRHYFEDFVARVLLRDYTAISTTAHPYRHRREILQSLDLLEESDGDLSALADAYLEARLVADRAAALNLVYEDLNRIRRVFERIEEAFEAIQRHRARLEVRLRNVVRYAGRRTSFLERSTAVIRGLDMLVIDGRRADTEPRGVIEPRIPFVAPTLLAKARGVRSSIEVVDLAIPPPDPLRELRRRLEREYLDRLTVSPAKLSRFLQKQVPPFGQMRAAHVRIEDVEDFLAFEALRGLVAGGLNLPLSGRMASMMNGRFELSAQGDGRVDNDWIECADFLIRRLDDSVTMESKVAR